MPFGKCFLLVFKCTCDVINIICISKFLELSLPPKLSTRSPFMDQNKEQYIELLDKLLLFSSNICMNIQTLYGWSIEIFKFLELLHHLRFLFIKSSRIQFSYSFFSRRCIQSRVSGDVGDTMMSKTIFRDITHQEEEIQSCKLQVTELLTRKRYLPAGG